MGTRRARVKLGASTALAAALLAGFAAAFALAGGSASPTDDTTAPVTTVVAPTATAPPVSPDQPPAPATATPKPKPKPKPKPQPTSSPTHAAPSSTPTRAPVNPVQTRPTRIAPSGSTRVITPRSAGSTARHRQAALKANRDRSAKRKQAELKSLLGPVPKPTYPLTPPGGGEHARTPIHHFVYLLQENHTFDNYFGTYGKDRTESRRACACRSTWVTRRPAVSSRSASAAARSAISDTTRSSSEGNTTTAA